MLDTAPQPVVRPAPAPAVRSAAARRGSRDPYYDGIRAIAVAAVLAYHWFAQYVPLFQGGYVGVDVFFVLSGFVITSVLWNRDPPARLGAAYRAFLAGRVRRLYPALLAMLAVGTAVVALTGVPVSTGTTLRSAFLALAQTTSFVQAVSGHDAQPFGHAWTLSVEWSFYLLWPLVLLRARRAGRRPERLALGAVWTALVLYAIDLLGSPRWFYFALTSRAPQLLAGCALALWAASGRHRPRMPAAVVNTLAGLSVAGIVWWAVAGGQSVSAGYRVVGYPLVTACSIALCAVPFLARDTAAEKAVGRRPLAVLGVASYSLYLWHLLAVETIDPRLVPLPPPGMVVLVALVTAAVTWLSYRYLERPFLRSHTGSLRVPAGDPLASSARSGKADPRAAREPTNSSRTARGSSTSTARDSATA